MPEVFVRTPPTSVSGSIGERHFPAHANLRNFGTISASLQRRTFIPFVAKPIFDVVLFHIPLMAHVTLV